MLRGDKEGPRPRTHWQGVWRQLRADKEDGTNVERGQGWSKYKDSLAGSMETVERGQGTSNHYEKTK